MGSVVKFSGPDLVAGFESAAKLGMGLETSVKFKRVRPARHPSVPVHFSIYADPVIKQAGDLLE